MKYSAVLAAVAAGAAVEASVIPAPIQHEVVDFKNVEWKHEVPDNKFVVEQEVKNFFVKNVKKDNFFDKKRRDELRLKHKDQKVVLKVVQEIKVVNIVLKGKPWEEKLFVESDIVANFDKQGDKTVVVQHPEIATVDCKGIFDVNAIPKPTPAEVPVWATDIPQIIVDKKQGDLDDLHAEKLKHELNFFDYKPEFPVWEEDPVYPWLKQKNVLPPDHFVFKPAPPVHVPVIAPPKHAGPPVHVPAPIKHIPAPPIKVIEPPKHIPAPPPKHIVPPPVHIPEPPKHIPAPPVKIVVPPKHVPEPPKHIPVPPVHVPEPPKHIPAPPVKIVVPPKHVPEPPKHIPVPPVHVPEPPKHIPAPPIKVIEPPKHIPVPPVHVPEPPKHIPVPPVHVPEPPKHIPAPPIKVIEPPKHVPAPPVHVPEPPKHW